MRRRLLAGVGATAMASAGCLLALAPPAAADVSCAEAAPRYIDQTSYALGRLAAGRLWQVSTGDGVTVAVVDSGVAADNAHLRDAVRRGRSFVPGDDDPTGRTDVWGHGTAVAGIVAARPVEGSRVYGIAPSADILPVRVFGAEDPDGSGQVPDALLPDVGQMAAGIEWAARNGADVINVSMSTRTPDDRLRRAVEVAVRNDAVVVASGGNRDVEGEPDGRRYPAAYPGVIGVAASDEADQVTEAAIHGPHIDVHAPGQNVITAYMLGGDCLIGTDMPHSSYAAGYVSGVAALLRAEHPGESAEEITYRILASADRPQRDERDDVAGWGMLAPLEALGLTFDSSRPGPPLPGATVDRPEPVRAALPPVQQPTDPFAALRDDVLWWLLLGTAGVTLALVLRPLLTARRRRASASP